MLRWHSKTSIENALFLVTSLLSLLMLIGVRHTNLIINTIFEHLSPHAKFKVVKALECFLSRWKADFPFYKQEKFPSGCTLHCQCLWKGVIHRVSWWGKKKVPSMFQQLLKNGHNLICRQWKAEGSKEGPLSLEKCKTYLYFPSPQRKHSIVT